MHKIHTPASPNTHPPYVKTSIHIPSKTLLQLSLISTLDFTLTLYYAFLQPEASNKLINYKPGRNIYDQENNILADDNLRTKL